MNNYDYATGTRYGYVSSNDMRSDIVASLMDEHVTKDVSYDEYISDCRLQHDNEQEALKDEAEFNGTNHEWIDFYEQEHAEEYEEHEPVKEIEYQGVKLISSWHSGSLDFFVIESPHTATVSECSLCVPGAGNLNLDDVLSSAVNFDASNKTYSIPLDWFYNFDQDAYDKGKQDAKKDGGIRLELGCMQLENYGISLIERIYWLGYVEHAAKK